MGRRREQLRDEAGARSAPGHRTRWSRPVRTPPHQHTRRPRPRTARRRTPHSPRPALQRALLSRCMPHGSRRASRRRARASSVASPPHRARRRTPIPGRVTELPRHARRERRAGRVGGTGAFLSRAARDDAAGAGLAQIERRVRLDQRVDAENSRAASQRQRRPPQQALAPPNHRRFSAAHDSARPPNDGDLARPRARRGVAAATTGPPRRRRSMRGAGPSWRRSAKREDLRSPQGCEWGWGPTSADTLAQAGPSWRRSAKREDPAARRAASGCARRFAAARPRQCQLRWHTCLGKGPHERRGGSRPQPRPWRRSAKREDLRSPQGCEWGWGPTSAEAALDRNHVHGAAARSARTPDVSWL
jgi:hypothetical protein